MATKLNFLIFLSILALQSKAEIGGSVVFFDAPGKSYVRTRPLEIDGVAKSLSTNEVAATISVLLGFAPPAFLSLDSSSKLNEVLFPNPFDRPRAVFLVEVVGVNDPLLSTAYSSSKVGTTSTSLLDSNRATIHLTDEDEISLTQLDGPLGIDCDSACVEYEFRDLAQWLKGTYTGLPDSDGGKLSFPLSSDFSFDLHMSKESDRHFALSLLSFVKNIKKAVELHEDLAGNSMNPAELLMCRFTGIEIILNTNFSGKSDIESPTLIQTTLALQKEYGSGDTVHHGIELLEATITMSFELLQKSHGGKIVGVVLSNNKPSSDLGAMINVEFSSRESRWLEEAKLPNATTIAEVILVRRTLAWITGIILLVSTLIGIYFLLNMPLTRDTLLYSNVKID